MSFYAGPLHGSQVDFVTVHEWSRLTAIPTSHLAQLYIGQVYATLQTHSDQDCRRFRYAGIQVGSAHRLLASNLSEMLSVANKIIQLTWR